MHDSITKMRVPARSAAIALALSVAILAPAGVFAEEQGGDESWRPVRFDQGRLLVDLPRGYAVTRGEMTDFSIFTIKPEGAEKPKATLGIYMGFAPNFDRSKKPGSEGVKAEESKISGHGVLWLSWTEEKDGVRQLHVETLVKSFFRPTGQGELPQPASPILHFFIIGTDPDEVALLRKVAETFRSAPRVGPGKGTFLWDATFDSPPSDAAAAEEGRVYIGTNGGRFHALDARNGKKLWTMDVSARVQAAPAISKGRLYFASMDDVLHCVEADTGRKIWACQGGEGMGRGSPAVDSGRVYVSCDKGSCLALDETSGKLLWKCEGAVAGNPVVSSGRVLLINKGRAQWLDGETGRLMEEWGDPAAFTGTPAVHGGKVFINSEDGKLRCLWQGNRRHLWTSKRDAIGAMAVFGSDRIAHLLVYGGEGKWLSMDTGTGNPWGEFETGSPVSAPALASSGRGPHFIVCGGGKVFCLTGHPLSKVWETNISIRTGTGVPVLRSPVVSEGRVFVPVEDGRLVCLEAGDADGWPMLAGGPEHAGTNSMLGR